MLLEGLFGDFFYYFFCVAALLAAVDGPSRSNAMQLCEGFALRVVLIFSGSAKLQLLFNWLLGWVNSEYLPVVPCSVMKTR